MINIQTDMMFVRNLQAGVMSTYQLFGKYLSLKSDNSIKEHQDAMFNWLKSIVRKKTFVVDILNISY
jgi:hypothetical protein